MAYQSALLALDKLDQRIPTLPLPEALFNIPLSIAGVMIVLFSIEHIIALIHGTEVTPAWH